MHETCERVTFVTFRLVFASLQRSGMNVLTTSDECMQEKLQMEMVSTLSTGNRL